VAIEQAVAALRAGDPLDAERTLRKHLVSHPMDVDALTKLAEVQIDERRINEATVLLRQAVGLEPSPARRLAMVHHLNAFNGPAVALAEIETLPLPMRQSFDVEALEASLLGVLGNHAREIEIYWRLLERHPAHPALWMSIGNALKTVGRTEEAIAALRRAIDVRPTYGEAYWTLANFKSFRFTERDVAAMRKALRGKLDEIDALHFEFALGRAYEDSDRYAQSFRHYGAGNRIRADKIRPADRRVTPFVDAAIATFDGPMFDRHAGTGCTAADPIFVLGLHRSGSTLIEQILASHPLIEGTAELPVMQQVSDRLGRLGSGFGRNLFQQIASLEPGAAEELGAEYLERSRAFRLTDRPFFVDKLPANWMNIGLIRLALPNAKIIDARRHPMACGFSNFKQHYASGMNFAYSLESIGFFYRDYVRFMDHMDRVQPGAIHRVLNERLIDDPVGETRRLLDYIGVPFDPACLDFHRNKRAVNTPSAEQVRRPINRDGVDYWRHYEPWLDPLKHALGSALATWAGETA
jgi:tetratricopeptide (TPR) repeat protein